MTDPWTLLRACRFLRGRGARHLGLAFWSFPTLSALPLAALRACGVSCLVRASGAHPLARLSPLPVRTPEEAAECGLDAVVVSDGAGWPWCARYLEPLSRRGVLVLPAGRGWVVPRRLRRLPAQRAWEETSATQYVGRSGLGGHYLEFGTFWGRSFFPAYFRFRSLLSGRFFAFDSFEGLSKPSAEETAFTGGDFRENAYAYNLESFRSLAAYLGVEASRLEIVPGFYDRSLAGRDPAELGLDEGSVSVCVIDCDLFEPTRIVLDFVTPLLEPGALLYFDDWRLCRASPHVGERAAALEWLARHKEIELVELDRDHWQNQWFIFQR